MDEATQIKPALDQPRFTLQWPGDKEPGAPVALDVLLADNAENVELCEWARAAVHDSGRIFGGGAAPMCSIRRVS
jgi:hypothetical protein